MFLINCLKLSQFRIGGFFKVIIFFINNRYVSVEHPFVAMWYEMVKESSYHDKLLFPNVVLLLNPNNAIFPNFFYESVLLI